MASRRGADSVLRPCYDIDIYVVLIDSSYDVDVRRSWLVASSVLHVAKHPVISMVNICLETTSS